MFLLDCWAIDGGYGKKNKIKAAHWIVLGVENELISTPKFPTKGIGIWNLNVNLTTE